MAPNALRYVTECLTSGWISSEGPFVQRFEEAFARQVGRLHGVAVCNGSAALDVAVAALGIGPGDEVIMPSLTIISCAAAVVRAGATPVVVDSHADSWTMKIEEIERNITPRTKAIMPVHVYGLPVDMDPLLELASRHRLRVIEDAAEAHGLMYGDRHCGSFGDISTFSFYPNKFVTTGEGGMIMTDDPALAARCRSLRNLCFQDGARFVHKELGWNMRMSSLPAALGLAQLEELDRTVARKRQIGEAYNRLLSGLRGVRLPLPQTARATNGYWAYGLVLGPEIPFDAAEAMRRLLALGIGTRPFFWPMHEQPVFLGTGRLRAAPCPNAEMLARRGFYIPNGLTMTDSQITQVGDAVRMVVDSPERETGVL